MNTYHIQPVSGQPDWRNIPVLQVDTVLWLPDTGIKMRMQLCYDRDALYVHQRAWETHIRAEHTEPLAQACEDSCMEFFFCPDPNSTRYFNFEITPRGFSYVGLFLNRDRSTRLFPAHADSLFDIRPSYTDDGWELYYRIPLSFITLFFPDFRFTPGLQLRANCFKCGELTRQPHYLSWNPIDSVEPDFHRPQDFGLMILD